MAKKAASAMTLDDIARARIVAWRKNTPGMTQQALGERINRNAVWVSRWENERFKASLDDLTKLCRAFGHTLFAALDVRQDAREQEILDLFRVIRAEKRETALNLLYEIAGVKRPSSKR